MSLTSKERIEKYLLTSIDAAFDAQIAEWIEAVTQYMNQETRRQLVADDTETSRLYDGVGKKDLIIDDFLTISEVRTYSSKTDVTGTDVTDDIYFYPANSTPKWRIESTDFLTRGNQNVEITGRYGTYASDALPADLVQAATVLVAGIVNYSNQSEGEIKSESIGRYTVTYVTEKQSNDYATAIAALKHHKRIR